MLDLLQASVIAKDLARSGKKHKNYERTLALTREYRAMITGDDLEYLLRRFDRRESQEDFDQANRIAQQITPAITSALMNPARKLSGLKPVVDQVDYGTENDPKAKALNDMLEHWHAGKDVDSWITSLIDPSDADPNAFAILTFDPFDHRREKPLVYPVIAYSQNVYDFKYVNGILEYLWLSYPIEYVTKDALYDSAGVLIHAEEKRKGIRYVLYTKDHHIVLRSVQHETAPKGPIGVYVNSTGDPVIFPQDGRGFAFGDPGIHLWTANETAYRVEVYDQKSGRVPAMRLGCKPDALTNGEIMVNRWHEALSYLRKSLKQVRELDLTTAMHAFPQKIQYVTTCKAPGCNKGLLSTGVDCGKCQGSGMATIGTAQDHITLPLPRDKSDQYDLTSLVHYVPLPVEIIVQLREIVKETRADAFRAVYGHDLYGDGQVGKVYEQVLAMNQAMYDALSSFAQWWSFVRSETIHVFAAYHDMDDGLRVTHHFPRNFHFENAADLVALMGAARTAGASKSFLANLNRSLVLQAFGDSPDELSRAETEVRLDPFPGMSEGAVTALIAGGSVTEKSALLWTEMATIMAIAAERHRGFYGFTEAKQRQLVNAILDEMIAAQATPSRSFELGMEEDEDDEDAEDEPAEQRTTKQGEVISGPFRGNRKALYWTIDGKRRYDDPNK